MGSTKSFVLDTNVLLYDPRAIFKFADNEVVLPIVIIEEIDKFKRDQSDLGRNARMVSRHLDDLRKKDHLSRGVPLDTGGTLRVVLGPEAGYTAPFPVHTADDQVLAVAHELQARAGGNPVVFVTKDTNLRIKADAYGLDARDYEDPRITVDDLYSGIQELEVGEDVIGRFYQDGAVGVPADVPPLLANQYVQLRSGKASALGRYDAVLARIVALLKPKKGVWGIHPRNREQSFAFDLLLNDSVKLATLVGKAGTGKTLLAIAAGLLKTADEGAYRRLLVSRPIFPLGRDIGFLPGELEDKLRPWMQPIFDNLELIVGGKSDSDDPRQAGRGYEFLIEKDLLAVEPLVYIRGRSIPNQFLLVDEAQNLTPHEVKTIVTRAGDETKVVFTGDPNQIDHPYLDSSHNGLVYLVERFKGDALGGHVTLMKGERSPLAERAANLL